MKDMKDYEGWQKSFKTYVPFKRKWLLLKNRQGVHRLYSLAFG